MSLNEAALTARLKRALATLGPVMASEDFYLAGGTAVAIHLGHRRSVDLDWFAGHAIGDPLVLAKRLADRGLHLAVDKVASGKLHGRLDQTRVSFLEYRYPLLAHRVNWPEYQCQLAGLDDLAGMKLSAIAQRGAKKDFMDLYALVTNHRPLSELLATYRRKYEIEDVAHVLYSLAYFDDADRERMPTMLWHLDWRTVKRAIRGWVKEIVR